MMTTVKTKKEPKKLTYDDLAQAYKVLKAEYKRDHQFFVNEFLNMDETYEAKIKELNEEIKKLKDPKHCRIALN